MPPMVRWYFCYDKTDILSKTDIYIFSYDRINICLHCNIICYNRIQESTHAQWNYRVIKNIQKAIIAIELHTINIFCYTRHIFKVGSVLKLPPTAAMKWDCFIMI